MAIKCPACNTQNLSKAKFCEQCGFDLCFNFCSNPECEYNQSERKIPLKPDVRYCNSCGSKSALTIMSEKQKATAETQHLIEEDDEMVSQAIECIIEAGQASTSLLQRRLKLGYARSARLIDQLESKGIVGPFDGSRPRCVLISKDQWMEMKFASLKNSNSPHTC